MCRTDFDEAWEIKGSWRGVWHCYDCGWKGPMLIEELGPVEASDGDLHDLVLSDCVMDWSPRWEDDAWNIADGMRDQGIGCIETQIQGICDLCLEARRWLQVWCKSWIYGDYREDIVEHWVEDELAHTITLGKLVLAADRKWKPRGTRLSQPEVARMVDRSLAELRRMAA